MCQEFTKARNKSNHTVSSQGSWSPGQVYLGKDLSFDFGESIGFSTQAFSNKPRGLSYDAYEYLKFKSDEDFVVERWRQQQRINSGSLVLCAPKLF